MNGPALASRGKTIWAVWYTEGMDETPRVLAARSTDRGKTFDAPRTVAKNDTLGRVDVVILEDGSGLVSYLEDRGEGQKASLRVRGLRVDGTLTASVEVARVRAGRSSGFPRMTAAGRHAWIAWTDHETGGRRVRLARLAPMKK